jgi:hypothetical protein
MCTVYLVYVNYLWQILIQLLIHIGREKEIFIFLICDELNLDHWWQQHLHSLIEDTDFICVHQQKFRKLHLLQMLSKFESNPWRNLFSWPIFLENKSVTCFVKCIVHQSQCLKHRNKISLLNYSHPMQLLIPINYVRFSVNVRHKPTISLFQLVKLLEKHHLVLLKKKMLMLI